MRAERWGPVCWTSFPGWPRGQRTHPGPLPRLRDQGHKGISTFSLGPPVQRASVTHTVKAAGILLVQCQYRSTSGHWDGWGLLLPPLNVNCPRWTRYLLVLSSLGLGPGLSLPCSYRKQRQVPWCQMGPSISQAGPRGICRFHSPVENRWSEDQALFCCFYFILKLYLMLFI